MGGKDTRPALFLTASAAALAIAIPALSAAGGATTELTSRGPGGATVHATSSTYGLSLSASGRYAVFTSNDDALPGADDTRDVYVRDRKRAKTILVSRSTSGEPANDGCSDDPAISGDGRFVAFGCNADNLGGGTYGLFVRDLKLRKTKLVSRNNAGVPANSGAGIATISGNGRYVAFQSSSTNLPGASGITHAYVRDIKRSKTILVTKTTAGLPLDDSTQRTPSISANGRYVVFIAKSALLPGNPGVFNVYIRDLRTKTTKLVSRTSKGKPGNGNNGLAVGAISAKGRYVTFASAAANLGASPGESAILRDLKTGRTRVVSRTTSGAVADADEPKIAAGGRFIAYASDDDDLPGVDGGVLDIYRYDLKRGKTILISRSRSGAPGSDDSFYPSISRSGKAISFTSRADNLSQTDDDLYSNTFVRVFR